MRREKSPYRDTFRLMLLFAKDRLGRVDELSMHPAAVDVQSILASIPAAKINHPCSPAVAGNSSWCS